MAGGAEFSDLFDSDQRYFEAGSELLPLVGGRLALMREFAVMPAGCLVVRVDPLGIGDADAWLDGLEARILALGGRPRLYLAQRQDAIERAMAARGYETAVERAYGFFAPLRQGALSLSLDEVVDEVGWRAKEQIHAEVLPPPHGEKVTSESWTAFERAKAQAGYMAPYLASVSGELCGSVSFADGGSMLRVKNLIVLPAWRRRGVARAIIAAAVRDAQRRGKVGAGLFAVDGTAGDATYRQLGGVELGLQHEWMG
jgi:GNAT superfamily N-acetyltransferase